MNFSFFFLFFMAISTQSFASVWNDTQVWSIQYEEEFSNWMNSNKVHEKIFADSNSPYYGINTDCADTAYALRAVFAFEHSLPFAISNPTGDRGGKKLSNHSNAWDKAGASNKRLVAMINEIGESVGTENLTRLDTFSTSIKTIRPGTIFTYSISGKFGRTIRHTYNIKAINPIGTFDVIYSTQANKAARLPLIRRKDRELIDLPHDPWGFRKFRWPELLGHDLREIPKELGPSMEQYELATSLGSAGFFKYVKNALSTVSEASEQKMNRTFKTLCEDAQARIIFVNQGLEYQAKTNNKCMDYTAFDTYSTPARDEALKESFLKAKNAYQEVKADNELNKVSPELVEFSEIIFDGKDYPREHLLSFCPINYRSNVTIDLAILWSRIEKDQISSHPNDIVEIRWGEKSSPKTNCKRWY